MADLGGCFVAVCGFDEEDKDDGEDGGGGKDAEDGEEGDVVIAENAETPIGKAATTDADKVHDAVAGGAEFGPGDLGKDGHVVAIEKSPAEAEEDEKQYGHREEASLRGVTDAEHRGDDKGHADGAGIDASALGATHPAVREPAAADGAEDGGDLPVERGRHAGFALADVEFGFKDGGHPIANDPSGQRREGEVEDEQDERGFAEEFLERASGKGIGWFLPGGRRRRIAQEEKEGESVNSADNPAEIEGPTPAEPW